MKKWIAALCAVVIIAGATIGIIVSNNGRQVDALNQDLADRQGEIDTLVKQTEADAKTIQDLNTQVTQAQETIGTLTAENGRLTGEIETLTTNLSFSEQKLQQIYSIITGVTESASPYTDVPADSPYFAAVSYVTEKGLLSAVSDGVFGLNDPITLSDWTDSVGKLEGLDPVETPAAEPAEEPAAEQPAEEPAAEQPAEEPAAEQPAEEPVAEQPAEEPVAEQPAAEQPAEEPIAEQPAEEPAVVREALLNSAETICKAAGLTMPEITLPETDLGYATRGDLAMVLAALDQMEKE